MPPDAEKDMEDIVSPGDGVIAMQDDEPVLAPTNLGMEAPEPSELTRKTSPASTGVNNNNHRGPSLGMLVDRSSFDETDSYGVNRQALQVSFDPDKLNSPQSTVLKNGKVRRRMRWRPKRFKNNNGDAEEEDDNNKGGSSSSNKKQARGRSRQNKFSSDDSVASIGESSRASQKSLHSFASTQTVKQSNNVKTQNKKMPLPRPNYPNTLDSSGSGSKNDANNNKGLATIGNEESMIQARMAGKKKTNNKGAGKKKNATDDNPAQDETVFEAADPEGNEQEIRIPSPTHGQPKPASESPSNKSNSSNSPSSAKGTPPLFQRKPTTLRSRSDSNDAGSQQPLPPRKLKSSASMPSPPRKPPTARIRSADHFSQSPPEPEPSEEMPSLSNHDDLLSERRVDLRIPQAASSAGTIQHKRSSLKSAASADIDDISVDTADEETDTEGEDDERDQRQPPGSGRPPKPQQRTRSSPNRKDSPPLIQQNHSLPIPATNAENGNGELRFSMSESRSSPVSSPPRSIPANETEPEKTANENTPVQEEPESDKNSVKTEQPSPSPSPVPTKEEGTPASPRTPTPSVPVDLDDGTFLDAEKNLAAIHEIGAEHIRHGEYAEALEVFEEILRGQLTRYGKDHYRVGTALHNIALVHMKRFDYPEAARVCREAVRVRQIALGEDHPDLAVSLAQLGVAYLELGKNKKAIVNFRQALKIRRKVFGSKHAKVAKLLNNIGCALYELTELEVAKVAFEEALDIQRDTLRDMNHHEEEDGQEDTPNQVLLSIASTLCNIGSIKLYWGQFDEAGIDLEEALLIQQSVLGDDHPLSQRTVESLDWIESARTNIVSSITSNDDVNMDNNSVLMDGRPKTPSQSLRGLGLICSSSAISDRDDTSSTIDTSDRLKHAFGAVEKKLMLLKAGLELTCSPAGGNLASTWNEPCVRPPDDDSQEEKKKEMEVGVQTDVLLQHGQALI